MTMLDMLVEGRMKHGKIHNIKKADTSLGTIFYSSIISATSNSGTSAIATATGLSTAQLTDSAFTTIVQTVVESITEPATTLVTTHPQTIRVTDPTSYSLLRASGSSENAKTTSTTSQTSSAPASTSSAAAKSSTSNNMSTLVPAIVVPVAVVLLASFALFWFVMRRRHQRQIEAEPEFVMATKPEKALSRGNSCSSRSSSTRELVSMSKLEKEMAVTSTEVIRPSIDLFPPNYPTADIGIARPMTPPDKAAINPNPFAKVAPSVPNFSSVRPSVSGRSRLSQDKNHSNIGLSAQLREITTSRDGDHTIPQNQRGLLPQGGMPALTSARTIPGHSSRPNDLDTRLEGQNLARAAPTSVYTNMRSANRAAPPKPINPPTPTSTFNGASPSSQYSPFARDTDDMAAIGFSQDRPAPLKPSGRVDSPIHDNVLSPENMRIARLANSSRLGFASNSAAETSSYEKSNAQTGLPLSNTRLTMKNDLANSLPSPELPPPLTRSNLPRKPSTQGPHSPAPGSSIYPSPSIGWDGTPRLGTAPSQASLVHSTHNGFGAGRPLEQRVSVVSRLSSDDEYVDMELDAKSDVSSLDEREKWQTQGERSGAATRVGTAPGGSSNGYGGAEMSSTKAPKPSGSSNLRDRDSEGPFVLSRYYK